MQHDKGTGLMSLSVRDRELLGGEPTPIHESQSLRLLGIIASTASYYAQELSFWHGQPDFSAALNGVNVSELRELSTQAETLKHELADVKDYVELHHSVTN